MDLLTTTLRPAFNKRKSQATEVDRRTRGNTFYAHTDGRRPDGIVSLTPGSALIYITAWPVTGHEAPLPSRITQMARGAFRGTAVSPLVLAFP